MTDHMNLNRKRWPIFLVLAPMYVLVYFYRVSLAVVAQVISIEQQLTPPQLASFSATAPLALAVPAIGWRSSFLSI